MHALDPGAPKPLITPIFHDFFRFFPVFPGTFGRAPWIAGVQTLKMGKRWGKMGKKWVKYAATVGRQGWQGCGHTRPKPPPVAALTLDEEQPVGAKPGALKALDPKRRDDDGEQDREHVVLPRISVKYAKISQIIPKICPKYGQISLNFLSEFRTGGKNMSDEAKLSQMGRKSTSTRAQTSSIVSQRIPKTGGKTSSSVKWMCVVMIVSVSSCDMATSTCQVGPSF